MQRTGSILIQVLCECTRHGASHAGKHHAVKSFDSMALVNPSLIIRRVRMTVKILIRRQFKEGALKDASQMLIQARTNAMGHKGYISSETLSSCGDPNTIMVLSMWQTKSDWDAYANSDSRMENEKKYSEVLEGSTEYEAFNLGLGH